VRILKVDSFFLRMCPDAGVNLGARLVRKVVNSVVVIVPRQGSRNRSSAVISRSSYVARQADCSVK